ncbi:hypothetical protein MACH16_26640 [Marinomonas pontica]|uniref:Choice-of-anchor I domain-containing protein n=2 Tax=Marinomonas pontica TaxID=264739 RepID=A0ABN6WPM1_9GAMM|nr:hypothetical protein MACH16_26640 [Marinomonas pontica]
MVSGKTYIVTANEGDSRDYKGFSEELRVKDLVESNSRLTLTSPLNHSIEGQLEDDNNLGRMKITSTLGANNCYHQPPLLGAFLCLIMGKITLGFPNDFLYTSRPL